MKVFVIALSILALLISLAACNSVFTQRQFGVICRGLEALSDEADETNARSLDEMLRLLYKNRAFLNMSFKRNELDQLLRLLSDAKESCLTGDDNSYRCAKEGALILALRFRDSDLLTAENIL